jgi:hypothetical protein
LPGSSFTTQSPIPIISSYPQNSEAGFQQAAAAKGGQAVETEQRDPSGNGRKIVGILLVQNYK